jgi:glutamyl-tRNA synthetase
MVVTRFAPSPTGQLHIGNVRTALLNWLYARRYGGRFLLRFEDTDARRSGAEFVRSIQDDLLWLGLTWDGEVLFQSRRHAHHMGMLEKLAEQGLAYRCFCTRHQLSLDRRLAVSRGLPPRYVGRCRKLSLEESAGRAEDESYVWRLAVRAKEGEIVVRDILRRDIHVARRDLDDPVVARSDGSFTFLLPNAIDDAMDGVTHVLRGDDHLTNSVYQVWLLEQLDLNVPIYMHHGLLLGSDGAKLSKRSGSRSISELRGDGLLPEALIQTLARLGHPNIPEQALSLTELAACFDAEHLSTAPVRWSEEDLWRWQTRILHALSPERLARLIRPYFPDMDEERLRSFSWLIGGNLDRLDEVRGFVRLLDANADINEIAWQVIREAGPEFFILAGKVWSRLEEPDWKAWTGMLKTETGRKGKSLVLPLRAALTGVLAGPEMSKVVTFLQREGVRERLDDCIRRLSQ